jgi:hypothetical protein
MRFEVRSSKLGGKVCTGIAVLLFLTIFSPVPLLAFTDADIASYQKEIADKPLGEKIALWAERFVGIPYDPDPLGEYVTKKTIVADERVDCMYLSFRAVELALGRTPEESAAIALDKRFMHRGTVSGGVVANYEDRFQYGEDILDSGKWGKEITRDIGPLSSVAGARGRARVTMIPKGALIGKLREQKGLALKSGDFVFFIKAPEKRAYDEIVGHIGIIKVEAGTPYLIHAGGVKNRGGEVKKVLFSDYVSSMPFAGVRVSRFLTP